MAVKIISKISTLDAARGIFLLVVGFSIKQSLGLFGHTWPSKDIQDAPREWDIWTRAFIGLGYLFTVFRFTHGVAMLHGHEKRRIENSSLPSASNVSMLSLFLVLLAIPLFLMADNIGRLEWYAGCAVALLVVDFLYVWQSNVVRYPLRRFRRIGFRLWSDTENGYAPRAALWWMTSDLLLLVVCFFFIFSSPLGDTINLSPAALHMLFAAWLILFTSIDYYFNWDFYFGGRDDRRQQKFVFVCSPLRAEGDAYKANINRAQLYCRKLMEWRSWRGRKITPFASHAFFTYFLNDEVPADRALGRECAIAYLAACDAVYAYAPQVEVDHPNEPGKKVLKYRLSHGMQHEVDEAKRFGLEIRYLAEGKDVTGQNTWEPPGWDKITYACEPREKKPSENYFRGAEERKRVYVCTRFRGPGFREKTLQEKRALLRKNTSLALWHCHELARDVDEAVAPFAPQAFYPYFWNFTTGEDIDEAKWKEWFDRSIEVLKVCDAVYVYTTDGMPPTDLVDPDNPESDNGSTGVRLVTKTAKKLGLEIQFRKELSLPTEEQERAEKEAAEAQAEADAAKTALENAEKTAAALKLSAHNLKAELGETHQNVVAAYQDYASAEHQLNVWQVKAKALELMAEEMGKDVVRKTWNPALPDF